MGNPSTETALDDCLEAMGRLERRHLLLRLATANARDEPHIDYSHLERPAGEPDPTVALRHLHLPLLEEREFVRWDRENRRVTKGPRFDELEPFLGMVLKIRRSRPDGES